MIPRTSCVLAVLLIFSAATATSWGDAQPPDGCAQCGPACQCKGGCGCPQPGVVGGPAARPVHDRAKAKATALLHLSKLCHERNVVTHDDSSGCMDDINEARTKAIVNNMPLMIWVGGCQGNETLRDNLPDCVHCHVESHNGNHTPRLIVPAPDGEWAVDRNGLRQSTPESIRGLMRLPTKAPVFVPIAPPQPVYAPAFRAPAVMTGGGACRS